MPEGRLPLSYVLPLKWTTTEGLDELTRYLDRVSEHVAEVLVVDGSPRAIAAAVRAAVGTRVRHLPPDPALRFRMGKVNGVTTGVLAARSRKVVIADDDVRYDRAALEAVTAELDSAELVRPHNYFDPLPWHARWDTGRTLLNRVFTGALDFPRGDFPGTFGVRRDFFEAIGGYDGDVMFENLQLMRTVRAAGGRVATPPRVYVARRPPTTRRFLSQRVRQAYDDFAIPLRMGAFLAAGPATLILAARRRLRPLLVSVGALMAAAELGRRRDGGAQHYPASGSLLAPAWVAERSVCAWLALAARRRGGVTYAGSVIARSADSLPALRSRPPRGQTSSVLNPTSL